MARDRELELQVDWLKCEGYGLCSDMVPGVIGLDDWRYPMIPEGPLDREHLNDVQRAIDCCPVAALRLIDAGRRRH